MTETGSEQPMNDTAKAVAQFLSDAGATHVTALDVHERSSFADAFVIAQASSVTQLQGFARQLSDQLDTFGLELRGRRSRSDESGWLLLDCGPVIVHLMLQEQREFYDLEKLWFDAQTLFSSENE